CVITPLSLSSCWPSPPAGRRPRRRCQPTRGRLTQPPSQGWRSYAARALYGASGTVIRGRLLVSGRPSLRGRAGAVPAFVGSSGLFRAILGFGGFTHTQAEARE